MQRVVEPELLDVLQPADARARASRGDLRRINAFMGNARIMSDALEPQRSIVELGAGDGQFMRQVARRLTSYWKNVNVTLVDRLNLFGTKTRNPFTRLGWHQEVVVSDVFESVRPANTWAWTFWISFVQAKRTFMLLRTVRAGEAGGSAQTAPPPSSPLLPVCPP